VCHDHEGTPSRSTGEILGDVWGPVIAPGCGPLGDFTPMLRVSERRGSAHRFAGHASGGPPAGGSCFTLLVCYQVEVRRAVEGRQEGSVFSLDDLPCQLFQ